MITIDAVARDRVQIATLQLAGNSRTYSEADASRARGKWYLFKRPVAPPSQEPVTLL